MQEKQTYYDVLGVARNAPLEVIKIVYRMFSQKHHPDKNQGSESAERMMKVLNEAYSVLSDPVKRAAYDAELDWEAGYSEPKQEAPPPPRPAPPSQQPPQKTDDGSPITVVVIFALIAVGVATYFLNGNSPAPSNQAQSTNTVSHSVTSLSPQDQYKLGLDYYNGQGVPRDYAKAAQLFQIAADQGYPPAQANLAALFTNGKGVPQDSDQAIQWYRKAAVQGYAPAETALGDIYLNDRAATSEDFVQAAQWYRKAADQGFADAQFRLGYMNLSAQGVPHNYAQAMRWFRKAADQGDASSQCSLGYMYMYGIGAPKSHDNAVLWLDKAVEQGGDAGQQAEKLLAKINHGGGSTAATPPHHSHTYTNADLPRSRPSCEYKQVMTNDDLRACGITPHD